jgi:hypothetical protein
MHNTVKCGACEEDIMEQDLEVSMTTFVRAT